jgi:Helicase associated domain
MQTIQSVTNFKSEMKTTPSHATSCCLPFKTINQQLPSESSSSISGRLSPSFGSNMVHGNSNHPPIDASQVLDVLGEVEHVLDSERFLGSSSSTSVDTSDDLEPTPMAADGRTTIVPQVSLTYTMMHTDEVYALRNILQPLLYKRQIEEGRNNVASSTTQTKKKRIEGTSGEVQACSSAASFLPTISNDPNSGADPNRFRSYQSEQWWERYADLVKFRDSHGHCLVPHVYPEQPALAQWVKR